MRGGKTPIHLMKFAPADYVNDPAVRLALARGNLAASTFYPLFIFHSFLQGGALNSDRAVLAATLGMTSQQVARALKYWIAQGKIVESDGQLYQKRVRREVEKELAFREAEAERKRRERSDRPADVRRTSVGRPSPQSEAPTPAPAPNAIRLTPAPNASAVPRTSGGPPGGELATLPADRRVERELQASKDGLERRLLELADVIHRRIPTRALADVIKDLTAYVDGNGARHPGVVEVSKLSYERLEKSIEDGQAWMKHLDAGEGATRGS